MQKRITLQQNLINHVGVVYDGSASMKRFASQVVEQSDQLIQQLKDNSQHFNQETRASMYIFGRDSQPACYDVDVLRTPSLRGMYEATADGTALIDAIKKAIIDMKQTATLYGDHAFLLYVLTDGQENCSQGSRSELQVLINTLPDNWTVAALVPDVNGRQYVMNLGFSLENTLIWNTHSSTGIEETTSTIQSSMTNYYSARSTGMRSTNSLFTVDTTNLSTRDVHQNLEPLKTNQFQTFTVGPTDEVIRDAVSKRFGSYKMGSTFYQLTKAEDVQPQKQIVVQDKTNGKFFTGQEARRLLGLPDYLVRVHPKNTGNFEVFIQSTAPNRKLIAGTTALVVQ